MSQNTLLLNGIKYLLKSENHALKTRSIEDAVYIAMVELFINYSDISQILVGMGIIAKLTNRISFEDRTIDFKYTNLLSNKNELKDLINFCKTINTIEFEFEISNQLSDNEVCQPITNDYIELDKWFQEFQELINLLQLQYNELFEL